VWSEAALPPDPKEDEGFQAFFCVCVVQVETMTEAQGRRKKSDEKKTKKKKKKTTNQNGDNRKKKKVAKRGQAPDDRDSDDATKKAPKALRRNSRFKGPANKKTPDEIKKEIPGE
jgi:uncharacterized membrane protein YdbT with pleckstrin-like domain